MTRQFVIDNQMVDKYLLGQLSDEDAIAFEEFYAGSPETLAELERAAPMVDAFDALRKTESTPDVEPTVEQPRNLVALSSRRSRWARAFSSPIYSAAASLVAIVACAGLFFQPAPTATVGSLVNVPMEILSPQRGSEAGIEIPLNGASHVGLALDIGYDFADSYVVTLLSQDGETLWQRTGLTADSMQSLTMVLDATLLQPGNYRVVVNDIEERETLVFALTTVAGNRS